MLPSSLLNAFNPNGATKAQREEIINWGIPNYSGKVSITSIPFTAPCDCMFYCWYYSYEVNVEFNVNNVTVYQNNEHVGSGDGYFNNNVYLYLKKGDVVTRIVGSGTTAFAISYFPLIGAQ